MTDKIISVLGCGWLGFPLAEHMIKRGFSVNGSTTTAEKLTLLKNSKISPFLLKATPKLAGNKIDSFFQSKILLLNIPFRRTFEDPNDYRLQIDSIIPHIENSPVEFVCFTSSTSVYPAKIKNALEDEPITPDNDRSEILRSIEQSLMDNQKFQTTVIRFAGMYGATRKIGQILAGRTGLHDGDSPVNLIHLDDCIAIITRIIEMNVRNSIFNACSDCHPLRRNIYTKAARVHGLVPPQFNDQPPTRLKIVSNTKLKKRLQYSFIHPDPLQF